MREMWRGEKREGKPGRRPETMSRFMVAAPGSGSGKTLITCGLLELLKRRGLNPVACKCGPDYIDPMFHRYVQGVPGRNLDSFFLSPEGVRNMLFRAVSCEDAGIAVLEGVMGYYDGLGGTSFSASSWEIASITQTPVLLVLDCKGMSLSAAAVAAGFLHFQKDSRIGGLFLNRVSPMYFQRLAEAITRSTGLPVLGYLPESEEYRLESRHLGLFLPEEIVSLRSKIEGAADVMEKTVDVSGLLALASGAAEIQGTEKWDTGKWKTGKRKTEPEEEKGQRVSIGVARDEAFCFYYQENLELLEQLGARLIFFSPLRDQRIPEGISGLVFGGGYPENFGAELAANETMRDSVREAARAGMPFLAECGGFLYLHRFLEGSDGNAYPMAGVYPFDAFRTDRLRRFGYVRLLTLEGMEIHGHEFHYWESQDPGNDWIARKPTGDRSWPCMHASSGQLGGFPHLYYESCPEFVTGWLSGCRDWQRRQRDQQHRQEPAVQAGISRA